MRIEIREKPYDLYLVMGASAVLVLVILLVPESSILRVILGLPFLLFFPGYTLISALYPERHRIIRKEEKEPGEDDDDEEENVDKKGLDGLERVALSLGLSIAITPLIGLVLNYTYDWDPEHLGIRLYPILFSQFVFIMIASLVAVRRRRNTPLEDRFSIVIAYEPPKDYTRMDWVLTVGIVVMMIASVILLAYIIIVPREGEAFTEFYVLGRGRMADEYPRFLHPGEVQKVFIGVGNHEHEDMNYTIVLTLDPFSRNRTYENLDNVTISKIEQPSLNITVEDGETLELECNFTIPVRGAFKLRVLLFHEGEEYRDLHLWVSVFSEDEYKTSANGDASCFISGPDLDPTAIPDTIHTDEIMNITVGTVILGGDEGMVNVSVWSGAPDLWIPLGRGIDGAMLDGSTGMYREEYVTSESTWEAHFDILLPPGEWDLHMRVKGHDWTINFDLKVVSEAP